MRVLILNADYQKFLRNLYRQTPGLEEQPYATQMHARNYSLFGVADFYSKNFHKLGHVAAEVHVNNPWLQYAWARENGLSIAPPAPFSEKIGPKLSRFIGGRARSLLRSVASFGRFVGLSEWEAAILSAQIESFEPDVILNQEIYLVRSDFLSKVKGKSKVVGQNAAILPVGESYAVYDFLISSLPNYVEYFCKLGKPAALNRLAFEPSVLDALGPPSERDIPLSFVGSLSPNHMERITFLEHVARHAPLKVWGNDIERLPASSPLHGCFQGEAWARDMYEILRRSKITLNKHIDIAENMANNMRLYEATGMGAALVTDNKANLGEIFTPDEQVVAYNSAPDCVRKIDELLADEPRRARIAGAGQQHAIRVQNYCNRVSELVKLFENIA